MKRLRFYYLDTETRGKLEALLQTLLAHSATADLMNQFKKLLPIQKRDNTSLRRHVEGLFYLSERLWNIAVEKGKQAYGDDFTRENLLRITKTLPMSHYRYLTGSREPADVLLTRDDALQDPPTALIKLTADINSLLDFIQSLPSN
jgi:hypothetical protein